VTGAAAAPRLILGSASPRRRDLLAQIGLIPAEVRAADIDETPARGELPRPYCERMAREKAEVLPVGPGEIILTADTTVALGRRILGKPGDAAEAAAFLHALSGRRHRVITSVAVRRNDRLWERTVETIVKVKQLSNAEVNGYLASGEWQGKAGGYGIQGGFGAFIPWLQGSFTGVVGLPVAETAQLLQAAGIRIWGQE
jgi:septum formation protein